MSINHFPNNAPVADFYCPACNNQYELKSKSGSIKRKINDGAYHTMIERITSNENPDFLFMRYSKENLCVRDLIFVPKHFFVPDIIEKRTPLPSNAKRAGWVGCNILVNKIPQQGCVSIISDGIVNEKSDVISKIRKGSTLIVNDMSARGWLMDTLNCVNALPKVFTLAQMYSFVDFLAQKHPYNQNIQAKIRQQLQVLRDKGIVEFLGNGKYRRIL